MLGLIDSSLREGGQTPGLLFRLADKIAMVEALAAFGIEEIELGTATPLDPDLPPLLAAARKIKKQARLALWCRCRSEDIRCAAALKPDILSLSLPASDRHIEKRLGKNRAWVLDRLRDSAGLAASLGLSHRSLGLEDAGRAEPEFLRALLGAAQAVGFERVRFADTVGSMAPTEVGRMVAWARRDFPGLELAFHAHNDFGLATANALAALDAGADWADVTVLGLGERAGCARLEELTAILSLSRQQRDYQMKELPGLCTMVAQAARRPIAVNHPLVGSAIFTCESGIHVDGLLKDPTSYEPFPPEQLNARRRILLGAKSGARAVAGYLAGIGLPQSEPTLPLLLQRIRQRAGELGRPLAELDIRALL